MNERAIITEESTAGGHRARLRQRLLDAGPEGFHDYELVEYLLTPTIPRVDTKPLAKKLLSEFGGIGPLLSSNADVLRREGLTDPTIAALKIAHAAALRLLESRFENQPVLSSWDALCDYLHATMAHRRTEEVRILFLNAKNMLLANEALWQGSFDEASVHVREVIARAIALGATAIIIVHNHPSGDPTPSTQDIRLTRDLVDAGRHMKVTVHDHVIVGGTGSDEYAGNGADLMSAFDPFRTLDDDQPNQLMPCAAGIGDGGPGGIASSVSSASPASKRASSASGSYITPTGFSA